MRGFLIATGAALGLLAACNNTNCQESASAKTVSFSPDAGFAAGSVHSGAECDPFCPQSSSCVQYSWVSCVVSADAGQLDCNGNVSFCSGNSSCGP